jgi:chemotaxis protein MotB
VISDPAGSNSPSWAVTFGDLMSLMLVFFVLLFSFASLDLRRFEQLSRALETSFGQRGGAELVLAGAPRGPEIVAAPDEAGGRAASTDAAQVERLRAAVVSRRLEGVLEVEASPRGVVLRVPAALLFEAGSDELRGDGLPLLHEIEGLLRPLPGEVSIEGHADDAGAPGAANFMLASERALAALRHLVEVEGFDAKRLRATGFGEVKPLFANSGPIAREKNRRVEFVLLRENAESRATEPPPGGRAKAKQERKAR